jgi:dipeptidyl aminopeptidase/acylaminoacyl peptidase
VRGRRVDQQLAQVELLAITYLSDGLRVRGYLAYPRQGENIPCVIYNRGGNRAFGAFDDVSAALTLVPLAAEGYFVVASQYRGNGGGEGREEFGGGDLNDVLNLIPLLEQLPRADATRIGMIGWSRGAMMTYLALTRTDRIAGAIVGGGEGDLRAALDRRPEMRRVYKDLIPGFADDVKGTLDARSVAQWPEKLHKSTPILILHGSADWRVDPGQALLVARRLYDARHPFRLVLFEGGDHGLNQFRGEVGRLSRGWLRKYVRDRAPFPSLDPAGR